MIEEGDEKASNQYHPTIARLPHCQLHSYMLMHFIQRIKYHKSFDIGGSRSQKGGKGEIQEVGDPRGNFLALEVQGGMVKGRRQKYMLMVNAHPRRNYLSRIKINNTSQSQDFEIRVSVGCAIRPK